MPTPTTETQLDLCWSQHEVKIAPKLRGRLQLGGSVTRKIELTKSVRVDPGSRDDDFAWTVELRFSAGGVRWSKQFGKSAVRL